MTSARDAGLLILRLGIAGLMFNLHGAAGFMRAFDYLFHGGTWARVGVVEALGFPMAGAFTVASALAESVGSALLVVGLFSRWAAMVLVIDMTVALYNEITGGDPIELPALYFVVFLALLITGPGRYSIDARMRRSGL